MSGIPAHKCRFLDNKCHPDAKIIRNTVQVISMTLINCSKETVKPALEWNHAEILSNGGVLDLFLNGEKSGEH